MTDRGEIDKEEFSALSFRQGSPGAFRIFFLSQYPDFFSFANLLLSDPPAAKNITTAVFFVLWAKHEDFDSEKNIKAFLYISIRDKCLHYLRSRQVHPHLPPTAPDPEYMGTLPTDLLRELLDFATHYRP